MTQQTAPDTRAAPRADRVRLRSPAPRRSAFDRLLPATNIGPRALANHHWYRGKFEDYPPRKARIPFVL